MFDWDEDNIAHVRRHGVEPEEAEEAASDPARVRTSAYNSTTERRQAYIGASAAGRILFVVLTMRAARFRILTAYDADKTEKQRYRKRGK
jgi:uncharacterized protein